jgi:hypothetical protein
MKFEEEYHNLSNDVNNSDNLMSLKEANEFFKDKHPDVYDYPNLNKC